MRTTAEDVLPAWTFRVPIRQGELLSSWLCRSAHRHGFDAYRFLSWRFDRAQILNRDVDLTAPRELLSRIDHLAALPDGTAIAATLIPFLPTLLPSVDDRAKPAHVPFVLSAGVFHRTRRRHGLGTCPACVSAGDNAFKIWGRLAFVVACPIHGCPVIDACPACDAPLVFHRTPVGSIDRCHACRAAMSRCSLERPGDDFLRAVRLQTSCLAALRTPGSAVAPVGCAGRDFLAMLRSLISVCAVRLDLTAVDERGEPARRQIERMRPVGRARLLAQTSCWLEDWPTGFRRCAEATGVSARSFSRCPMPETLAAEVARLPDGGRKRRAPWRSIFVGAPAIAVDSASPGHRRTERAHRLLAAVHA